MIECLGYGQDAMRFEQGGKIHLLSTYCSLEKKIPDYLQFLQTFARSRKLLYKFQDFFKISIRLCTNPGRKSIHYCEKGDQYYQNKRHGEVGCFDEVNTLL